MNGLLEVENPAARLFIVASGTAVSQSRDAVRILLEKGIEVGLIKIKSIRPFPADEIAKATEKAEFIFVPEFNAGGWLAKEIKASIDHNKRVIAAPRLFGGMTMPPELIADVVVNTLTGRGR